MSATLSRRTARDAVSLAQFPATVAFSAARCYWASDRGRVRQALKECAMPRPAMRIPRSWDPEAHRLYLEEKLEAAVNLAL